MNKYILTFVILLLDHIHQNIFSSKNKFINYNPHKINDNFLRILPDFTRKINMSILNNYALLTGISVYVLLVDDVLQRAFIISRTIRIIAIYLVQFPNPNDKAYIERLRVHDLIVSGHTINWNLIYIYIYNNFNYKISSSCLIILALYYIYIIKHKHHYSIDVFFGLYVSYTSYLICK